MVATTQLRLAMEKEEEKGMDLILVLISKTHFFPRNELARSVMGTIFLVYICVLVCLSYVKLSA